MKAFNTLVVVALSLVFSKNTAEASPMGQSLRRATLVDPLTGANLPSGSALATRQDLSSATGLIGSILNGLGIGGLSGLAVVPNASGGNIAVASDSAASVGDTSVVGSIAGALE